MIKKRLILSLILNIINLIRCQTPENEGEILSLASLLICIRDFDITSSKEKKYLYDNIPSLTVKK